MRRRQFLGAMAGAAAAPVLLRSFGLEKRLPIAFSTLGCPKWDWKTIIESAARLSYAAIELRGIQGEMDLTKRPEFQGSQLGRSIKDLTALAVHISDLGSSARMHEKDPARRAAQLDEGRRFIDLAQKMQVPLVRVFPDKIADGETRESTIPRIIDGLRELGQHARGSGVSVILESHGDFVESPSLSQILKGVDLPQVGLLWDTHHTFVMGKETPTDTFAQLGKYVRHTHLKDSVRNGKEVRYVLTGKGTVPVREIVRVLMSGGFKGYYCYEWEKAWHPEIEEPEVAFPSYAAKMREFLQPVDALPG